MLEHQSMVGRFHHRIAPGETPVRTDHLYFGAPRLRQQLGQFFAICVAECVRRAVPVLAWNFEEPLDAQLVFRRVAQEESTDFEPAPSKSGKSCNREQPQLASDSFTQRHTSTVQRLLRGMDL